jgi:hypothetical protein
MHVPGYLSLASNIASWCSVLLKLEMQINTSLGLTNQLRQWPILFFCAIGAVQSKDSLSMINFIQPPTAPEATLHTVESVAIWIHVQSPCYLQESVQWLFSWVPQQLAHVLQDVSVLDIWLHWNVWIASVAAGQIKREICLQLSVTTKQELSIIISYWGHRVVNTALWCVTIVHGVQNLWSAQTLENIDWAALVIGDSFLFEGLAIAVASLVAVETTGNVMYDPIGSIRVSNLLGMVVTAWLLTAVLFRTNMFLIGASCVEIKTKSETNIKCWQSQWELL